MTIDLVCASIKPHHSKWEECTSSWGRLFREENGEDGLLPAYQRLYESSTADLIAYFHDDLLVREPGWEARVLAEFEDPQVGLVGFGGATQHGDPELYKVPYKLQQLGRTGYLSNTDDAEAHGSRFDGSCDVAVVDGYALIIRRELLRRAGGWPIDTPVGYSLYDYYASAMVRRFNYRIRFVGIRGHHFGGMTAIGMKKAEGSGLAHVLAHRWLYDNFRDVLPHSVARSA